MNISWKSDCAQTIAHISLATPDSVNTRPEAFPISQTLARLRPKVKTALVSKITGPSSKAIEKASKPSAGRMSSRFVTRTTGAKSVDRIFSVVNP